MTKTQTKTRALVSKEKNADRISTKVPKRSGRITILDRVTDQTDIPLPNKLVLWMAAMAGISNAGNAELAKRASRIFTRTVRQHTAQAEWVASVCGRTGINENDLRMAADLGKN